jgi:hypothetical protein
MNPDKLEKYILDHREQFDDQEPDPAIWERVDTRQTPIISFNWKGIAWKAAAVAAIFTLSYFFHDFMASRQQASETMLGETPAESSPMVRELIEAEAYYTSIINLKKDEVFRLTASHPEVRHEIDMEMVDLDRVFSELKDDLRDNADNEEVIEAMIQNYRIKLNILEEMLHQLNESNDYQNEKDHENRSVEL